MSKYDFRILAATFLCFICFTCGCDLFTFAPIIPSEETGNTQPSNSFFENLFNPPADTTQANGSQDEEQCTGPRVLTVLTEGNGTVSPNGGSFEPDTVIKLQAQADQGWRFKSWKTSAPNTEVWFQSAWNPAVVIMNRDKTITAVFEEDPGQNLNPTPTPTPNPTMTPIPTPTPTPTPPAGQVADPIVTPPSQNFIHSLDILMSCPTSGAGIHFTTDGTEPTVQSNQYTGSYYILATTTLKVRAFAPGMTPSNTVTRVYTAVSPGTLKWSFPTSGFIYSSPAIGQSGSIYFGGGDGNVYAVNPDGNTQWMFPTGTAIYSSPAIGLDGTIHIGCDNGNLYALNPNGTLKWKFTSDGAAPIRTTPAIGPERTIYIGSDNGILYALNPDTGNPDWTFPTEGAILSSPVVGYDGTIYFGSSDNNVYAVDRYGFSKWSFNTGNGVEAAPAIGLDGTVYIGSGNGNLYALSCADGKVKWTFPTNNAILGSCGIADNGTVYFGSMDGSLYALDPTNGTSIWTTPPSQVGINSTPAVNFEGKIYLGYILSYFNSVDSSGTVDWQFPNTGIISSPTIGTDGTIYFTSIDHNLYALYGFGPLASSSSWPMFQHDARHTGQAVQYQFPPVVTEPTASGLLYTFGPGMVWVSCRATDSNGTVTRVFADLSEVGGSSNQELTYEPDSGQWKYTAENLQMPSAGIKTIKFTAVDNQNGTGVGFATITVSN